MDIGGGGKRPDPVLYPIFLTIQESRIKTGMIYCKGWARGLGGEMFEVMTYLFFFPAS